MTDKHPPDWPGPDDLEKPTLKAMFAKKRHLGSAIDARVMPYVGIAGFTDPHEVRGIAGDLYTMNSYGTPEVGGRRLAPGVLVSWKTLNGEPAGNPERYPRIEDVRALLDAAAEPIRHCSPGLGQTEPVGTPLAIENRTLRLIHYNSREPNLVAQVDRLCEIAGPNLQGFQFNIAWPTTEDIREIAQEHPTLRFVLQVNRRMFANVKRDPQLLAYVLRKKYGASVTDYLFDMSAGSGAAIDMQEAETVVAALYDEFGGATKGGTGIGIAGGLDYKNVYGLKPFFDRWPDLSIDAEGRVRDSYVNAKKETVTYINENAREFARRGIALALGSARTQTTP